MLAYFGLLSCLVILVLSKETPVANHKPAIHKSAKPKDLAIVESQEHSFLEAPSHRSYQQNSNGYNEEGGSAPEPYMFNYDIQDNDNNKQFRKEESNGNAVKGSYGYVDANGLYRTVEYTADSEYGFRAKVRTNEPGMDAYYLDNGKSQAFPADVILEVAESPRGLQYSSSDQVPNNNYYSGDNGGSYHANYGGSKGRQNYQQFGDQYAASNVDSQHFGRSLAYEPIKSEPKNERTNERTNEQARTPANGMKWNANWNKPSSFLDIQNDKYQSAYSDSHPAYVDPDALSKSRSAKRHLISSISSPKNIPNTNHKLLNNHNLAINHNSPAVNHQPANLDLVEMNSKVMSVVKNQKFSNKTDRAELPKPLATNLQLEKPMQQFRSLQHYRPFNEIRQKFIGRSPRRYTGFANDLYK